MTLNECQRILKNFYSTKMKNIPTGLSSDGVSEVMHTDHIFIDLELHKGGNTFTVKSREEFVGLMQEDRKCLVLKGEAGTGKTTFVRRLGFDWEKGVSNLSQFKLVFVLKMKEMTDCSGLLDAIRKQIFPKDRVVTTKCLRSVIDTDGIKVLFILDGFDEMNTEILNTPAPRGDFSVKNVLAVDALRECYLVVTTRPHMMRKLLGYNDVPIYTVIETTGFNKKSRNEYIRRRFPDDSVKAEGLIREIETAAFLEILAKRPVMLLLLCLIWDGERITQRITELYGKAMDVLDAQWARKNNRLPSTERWRCELQEKLGKVAFEGLMDPNGERLVFSRNEFSERTLKDGLELGVFSEKAEGAVVGYKDRTVTFLHKTFQEFFGGVLRGKADRGVHQKELVVSSEH